MRAIAFALIPLIGGCAATMQQHETMRKAIEDSAPVCVDEPDCKVKWEAAQIFVQQHAGMKLQTVTSAVIETFDSPGGSPNIAMSVAKVALGDGRYRLEGHAHCGNLFGCYPDPGPLLLLFNSRVTEARP